jgi:hypothetical protein
MTVDRYVPLLSAFALTADEKNAIASALATADPWGWKSKNNAEATAIASAKTKILNYHLERHGKKCCYCRVNLKGAGPFLTDREHVLPKHVAIYKPLSYAMWNLGIACKRCNMEYKKKKTDFVVAPTDATLFTDSANYLFIHPNFDLYREHMTRSALEVNEAVLVKYTVKPESSKGPYTYDYFNLRGLEVDSFDSAQGLDSSADLGDVALQVKALANAFGQ